MSNGAYQEHCFIRPPNVIQNQVQNASHNGSYSVLPNNAFINSQQMQNYQDYVYTKNQFLPSTHAGSFDHDWCSELRLASDIEKTFSLPDKIESIEITSKDLSPASYCSNIDLFLPDYCGSKSYNKSYVDYPSCSQVNANQDTNRTVKYCSIQKLSNDYDCNQYIAPTDVFSDVFSAEGLNFDPVEEISERLDDSGDSDIIVEDLNDDGRIDKSASEPARKFNCLVCGMLYSPVGTQFYYLTDKNPLTMSSQKSVSQKLKSLVGTFSSSYLCCHCLGLVNSIDHLEMKLDGLKSELKKKYEHVNKQVKMRTQLKCKHKLRCKFCKVTFSLCDIYRNHLQKHKVQNRFLCHVCGRRFSTSKLFDNHVKKHNSNTKEIETQLLPGFRCKVCKKLFRTNSNLKEHENYCTGKLPFKCTKCNKKLASTTRLKRHIKLKHDKKFTSICSICNIGFVQISDYKRHMISHSTDKKFNCPTCDKSYKTMSNLNFHMKFHAKKLPFICTICSKGFMRKEYLESHTASHTGEKSFACTLCEKKFVSQKNLDAHFKYHNGSINKKSCNVCGKIVSKIALQDHLRTHTNLKEFKCDICDLEFNTKSALQKHRKRKHHSEINN